MEKLSIKSLRIILVGLGSIGNRHFNNLKLLGLRNIGIVRRPNPNAQFTPPPETPIFSSIKEALTFRPHVAIICNPTHMHATTASFFLAAGTAILIEKPLSAKVSAIEESLAKGSNTAFVPCCMAYCMRFHPAYRLAKKYVDENILGNCLYSKAWFESFLPAWHPWEDYKLSYASLSDQGGGALLTLDHELDFLSWVLGKPSELTGFTSNTGLLQIKAEEIAAYNVRHNGQILSQVLVSYCRRPSSRGYEFVFEKGALSFRMEEEQVKVHHFNEKTSEIVLKLQGYDLNQMYVEMLANFLQSVINPTAPRECASVSESLDYLRLLANVDRRSTNLNLP